MNAHECRGPGPRLVNDDVAVVAYKAHEELSVEGKPVTLDVVDSSTWVVNSSRDRSRLSN